MPTTPEDLHVPVKHSMQTITPMVGKVIERELDLAEGEIDGPLLAKVLSRVLSNLGNDQRMNWLEIERWGTRSGVAIREAALFVASADAASTVQQQADLTVNGLTDGTQLNAFLAANPGRLIVLSAGFFNLDVTLVIPAGTRLVGSGRADFSAGTPSDGSKITTMNAYGTMSAFAPGFTVAGFRAVTMGIGAAMENMVFVNNSGVAGLGLAGMSDYCRLEQIACFQGTALPTSQSFYFLVANVNGVNVNHIQLIDCSTNNSGAPVMCSNINITTSILMHIRGFQYINQINGGSGTSQAKGPSGATDTLIVDVDGARTLTTDPGTNNVILPVPGNATTNAVRQDLIPALLVGDVQGVNTIPAPAAGSSPTGAAGGSLGGTYPNPNFSGRDSSVDKINQDLLPALLTGDVQGVQTIPTPVVSVAGTAVGGSLAGTLVNPTFSGRDSSVDKLNQDLLPSLLTDGSGMVTIPTPTPGSNPTGAAGGSLAGTYPNPLFAGRNTSGDEINKDCTLLFMCMGT